MSELPLPQTRPRSLAAAAAAFVVAVIIAAYYVDRDHTPSRQALVEARGAVVMPFDLATTTHEFTATRTGAYQQVTANSSDDTRQIKLIREHLTLETKRFQEGNFDDPTAVHGGSMPGLAALKRSAGRIEVEYAELRGGASIKYSTNDVELREALVLWIEAQNMDHGTGMNHG